MSGENMNASSHRVVQLLFAAEEVEPNRSVDASL